MPTVAALSGGDIATSGKAQNLAWMDTYPQAYSQADRTAILQVAYEKHLDADQVQLLLDELSGIEKKALVRKRPALFFTLVKQMNKGTFFGNRAEEERSYGTPLSPEELSFQNEGGRA